MADFLRDLQALDRFPSDERLRALERIIPLTLVQEVLRQTGHADRHYTRLPAWLMTFFVVALGLFGADSYRQAFKWLQRFRPGGTPARNALAPARQGLGIAPVRLLARQVVQLLGTPDTPGAFYQGLRLMALDGFVLDLPDSPANERAFGRPRSGRAAGAFPQARVLAPCETGSHVLYRWLVKPLCRGEVSMAAVLLRHLESDMLLLWDRNFLCYRHLQQVRDRQAHLPARLKSNLIFEPIETLADGSFLAKTYPSGRHRERDEAGVVARIIAHTLDDPARPTKGRRHRLPTTLLDAAAHPARELVVWCHERWEQEVTLDELKTHQCGRPVLRSQTPSGVVRELEGLLLAHYVVRVLLQESAQRVGVDPRRLSFVGFCVAACRRCPPIRRTAWDGNAGGSACWRRWARRCCRRAATVSTPASSNAR